MSGSEVRDGGTERQYSPHATREWKSVNSGSPRDEIWKPVVW